MEEQIGALLQSAPQIIKRVLRGLSARDIFRVTWVCRLWRKYAVIVLKERRRIVTMTATKQSQRNSQMTTVDNPETKEFLRDLDMECGVTIIFQAMGRRSLSSTRDLSAVASYKTMHSCLPGSPAIIGATCSKGIIGTSTNGLSLEYRLPTFNCISALLLPKLPLEGTLVTHFSLSWRRAEQLANTKLNKAALTQLFNWPKDQEIKCIIILLTVYVSEEVNRTLITAIRTVHDRGVALAGGVASEVYSSAYSSDEKEWLNADDDEEDTYFSKFNNRPAIVGLIFGGENVRAASLVLEEWTREGVENRLMELKEKVEEWGECKQKIGFMFTGFNRCEIFKEQYFEMNKFHQLMPNIPLIGMFSMGEIGWDYPPPGAVQLAKKATYSNDSILSRTTAFAVVGFV